MLDEPIDEGIKKKTKIKKKKKKKSDPVSWGAIIFLLVVGVIIPSGFIYFVVEGVDSGYWGGKPGYVSGDGFIIWLIGKLHLIIIGTVICAILFLILFFVKLFETVEKRLKR